jgi:alkylation response protein AidB-like acyl-CoA dehydrogenase
LGEIGKGHKIAFNVLNFARFKLGAMCVGGARGAIGEAARYAKERRQFGQPIASFGAIKHKLGEMIVKTYAIESLVYRSAGMIQARMESMPHEATDSSVPLAVFEEYAIEASIAKVAGSEMLDFVLDENIQIHGGNGFVRDYSAERLYRDSRVNRIFEGTNEINRLLIPGLLARRAAKGEPPLLAAAQAAAREAGQLQPQSNPDPTALDAELRAVAAFKKVALTTFGRAVQMYGQQLADQQEVLMHVSDMLMDTYAAESAVLRALSARQTNTARASLHADAARVFVSDAAMRLQASACQALAAMIDGDALDGAIGNVQQWLHHTPPNTAQLRRRLADEAVARGAYIF